MSIKPKDPLLAAGKVMTVLLMVMTGLVTILLLGIIPFILFNQGDFAEAVEVTNAASVGAALAASVALLLIGAAITAIAFHFFRLLGRIIDTVSIDDPFTAENAGRLSHMGWIALIFQLASFPIAGLVVYLGDYVPSDNLTVDYDFSLTGVLLAVVLFILARIFRHGAAMREDLEGTV
jgi:hypothetical protein